MLEGVWLCDMLGRQNVSRMDAPPSKLHPAPKGEQQETEPGSCLLSRLMGSGVAVGHREDDGWERPGGAFHQEGLGEAGARACDPQRDRISRGRAEHLSAERLPSMAPSTPHTGLARNSSSVWGLIDHEHRCRGPAAPRGQRLGPHEKVQPVQTCSSTR